MRAVSRESYERARDRWGALLRQKSARGLDFGEEAFAVADVLRASGQLARSLADSSRAAQDRARLASDVFSPRFSEEMSELVIGLVRDRWADEADIADSVELLGVQSVLAHSDSAGRLGETEGELYRAMRLLAEERDLRITLSDDAVSLARRDALADRVWKKHVGAPALTLIRRAVARAPLPTLAASLTGYVDAAAEIQSKLVASVTAASPLTRKQEERLKRILSARYGKDVSVHVAIDAAAVGGIRIHIGDDVIDATLATRIKGVKDAVIK